MAGVVVWGGKEDRGINVGTLSELRRGESVPKREQGRTEQNNVAAGEIRAMKLLLMGAPGKVFKGSGQQCSKSNSKDNLQEGRRPPGPYVDYVEGRLNNIGAVAPSQTSQSIQTSGESQLELWTPPRWFGGSITKQWSRIALVVHTNSGTWNKQSPFHSGSLMAHGHNASSQISTTAKSEG
ncbi:hypothetical protein I7I51_04025 [Histoplasma capsulatum]|uniref:Uncharacterized protein n=1 Tax=Ajellomyces capsulatus TaxID=5037 RepID=A0A8A1M5U0_AJECA|nr:hypothetical protein I7I51_04025 [Histoplasma capsulatum]